MYNKMSELQMIGDIGYSAGEWVGLNTPTHNHLIAFTYAWAYAISVLQAEYASGTAPIFIHDREDSLIPVQSDDYDA